MLAVLTAAAVLLPITTRHNVYCSQLCGHGAAQQLLVRFVQPKGTIPTRLRPWLTRLPDGDPARLAAAQSWQRPGHLAGRDAPRLPRCHRDRLLGHRRCGRADALAVAKAIETTATALSPD